MITPTQYDDDIKAIEDKERELAVKRRALLQLRAETLCPFKVGDILVDGRGRRAKITGMEGVWFGNGYDLIGSFILKNEKLGKEEHWLRAYEDWVKEEK